MKDSIGNINYSGGDALPSDNTLKEQITNKFYELHDQNAKKIFGYLKELESSRSAQYQELRENGALKYFQDSIILINTAIDTLKEFAATTPVLKGVSSWKESFDNRATPRDIVLTNFYFEDKLSCFSSKEKDVLVKLYKDFSDIPNFSNLNYKDQQELAVYFIQKAVDHVNGGYEYAFEDAIVKAAEVAKKQGIKAAIDAVTTDEKLAVSDKVKNNDGILNDQARAHAMFYDLARKQVQFSGVTSR